jgi:amidase
MFLWLFDLFGPWKLTCRTGDTPLPSNPEINKSVSSASGCESRSGPPARREFLRSTLVGGIVSVLTPANVIPNPMEPPSFDLNELTIAELQQGLQAGTYTARSLAEKYLARIDAVDKSGPAVNSVIELNPDALAIADALDKERKEKGPRGPLHGIPILVKDNIDTADRMMTTAGSLALVGAKPPRDAFLIQRLRQAGAVILGKTNPSEWANIRSGHSTSGWSGRGGLTRNPYALDRNPCGSSSGSGAAVSANLCAGAVGTETDGSIVCPSSANGLVGIKPTVGLVSRSGVIPISHTQDTAGPMCRTVRDAAILLSAMAGLDPEDGATSASKGHVPSDYTQCCEPNGLRGARIGVVRKYFGFSDLVDLLMEPVLDLLKKQGAALVDPVEIDSMGKFGDFEFTVLLYEFKADLNAYLARLGPSAPVHNLKEVIDFNDHNREKEMPYFGQDTFIKAEAKGPLTDKEYIEAIEKCARLTRNEGIDAVMDKLKLDALIAPTGGPAWITDLLNGDNGAGGSSSLAAVAGYPSITLPAGFLFGLPVGISFFGRAWSEPTLIKLAYSFEQVSNVRKAPSFLPSVGLKL